MPEPADPVGTDATPRSIGDFLRWSLRKIIARKRWLLLPLWILLVLIGGLILLSGGSALLPVIYLAF